MDQDLRVTRQRLVMDQPWRRNPSVVSMSISHLIEILALLTMVTLPSTTSPLKGFITIAVYVHLNLACPVEGKI